MVKTNTGNGPSQTTLTPVIAEAIGAVTLETGCFVGTKKPRCMFGRLSIGKLLVYSKETSSPQWSVSRATEGGTNFGGEATEWSMSTARPRFRALYRHPTRNMEMLILTRRIGETLMIGDDTEVTVIGVKGNQIRLGVTAPKDVAVHREEIYQRIQNEKVAVGSN